MLNKNIQYLTSANKGIMNWNIFGFVHYVRHNNDTDNVNDIIKIRQFFNVSNAYRALSNR